ncbi:MAG TPA: VOC family protein [Bdellovibrionota bacterium]|nr:VOC family protein [Bdellovibrionota bacterium]
MPNILVNIDVPDLVQAQHFYTAAFDLKPGRRFDGWVELIAADFRVYLLPNAEGSSAVESQPAVRRTFARHWTPVHLDFVVEALEPSIQRVLEAGAIQEGKIDVFPYGRLAYFSDPFGNGFCLLEFNQQGYDAIAADPSQLHKTTRAFASDH